MVEKTIIFLSYAHEDEDYRIKLRKHLSPLLRRDQALEFWDDRAIVAGDEWDASIRDTLMNSDVVLMLISSSFLSSSYIIDEELHSAMELHAEKKLIIIPVIIRPCDWTQEEFARFQGLPRNAKPISQWDNEDEAFLDVVQGIKRALEVMKKRKA